MSEMFAEEFSDEMAKQFQETMKGLLGNDPKMKEQIEKLAEAAEKTGIFIVHVLSSFVGVGSASLSKILLIFRMSC